MNSFSLKKFREIVLQLLFSIDMGGAEEEDLIPFLMHELKTTRKIVKEAYAQASGIYAKRESLDQKIALLSQSYAFERIGRVERNILRWGFFEQDGGLLDKAVVISEAIRLARKFSTPESADYVNALLDAPPPLETPCCPSPTSEISL